MSVVALRTARSPATEEHEGIFGEVLQREGDEEARIKESRVCLADLSFGRVLTSPRLRARETARLAGFPDADVDPDLAEWDYGDYEGITSPEIRRLRAEQGLGGQAAWDIWRDGCPGGESPEDVSARLDALIKDIRDKYHGPHLEDPDNNEVGDVLVFDGPSGGYRPDPGADWHLMVGDESALPAIAASLAAVPPGRPVVVRLLCDDASHELPLETPGDLDLVWLHRVGAAAPEELLLDALRGLDAPTGRVHAFVHGEASSVRAVRRHLLVEREIPREALSVSGYW